jgi:signal transduction histidine kinase
MGPEGELEVPLPIHREAELVAAITHDLRQPVTAVELNVAAALHYLQRREPQMPEAIAALLDAQGQRQRLREAIHALHALSERRESFSATVDAVAIVWDVVRLVAAEAQAHQVPMRLVVVPPIPPVAADGLMMRQALLNIALAAVEDVARRPALGSSVSVEVRLVAATLEIVVTHAGARPNAALLETWTMTVARSVIASHAATLTVEDGAGADVRIVTRWPIGVDPDARSATQDAPQTLTS